MTSRFRPTWIEVDLEAIRHNVRTLTPRDAELMAVVKANAYGQGDAEVGAAVEAGAAVARRRARGGGAAPARRGVVETPILVLSEFPPGSERAASTHA